MQHFFDYNSTRIAYRKTGQGTPVLLLHGFGEDSRVWDQQLSFLQSHCLLIVPDFPGSGLSPVLPGSPGLEDFAAIIYALLEHENLSKCVLLGHSMGGYIMLAFAEKYPEMLLGIGLVHSSAFADSPEKKLTRQRGIELIGQYGGSSFLKTTIPNLFSTSFKEQHADQVNILIERSADFSNQALQQYYRAMMVRPDRTKVLAGSKTPVLFIIGTDDVAAPLNDVLQQVSLPDYSYIHILKNVGHMGMWEAATAVNNHLLHFISALKT
jgi:pimeloyl-ACP methyl ester carboxylesterase